MIPHPLPTAASAAAPESHATSEAKRLANVANAQLSTGPTSAEGKAKSSLNALKTALTGRTVLLPTEDATAYQQHVSDYEKSYVPSASANAISSNPSPTHPGVCSASPLSNPPSTLRAAFNSPTTSKK
jgi:hypothetical protein